MGEKEEKFPAQWAIDLLEGPTIYKETFYTKHLPEIICVVCCTTAVIFKNYFKHRPWHATPHHYVIGSITGFVMGSIMRQIADYRYAKRDAIMADYVRHYPDRFPEPRNKKYAELFEQWHPLR